MAKKEHNVEIRGPYSPRKIVAAEIGKVNKTEAGHAPFLETERLIKKYVANPVAAQERAAAAKYIDVPAMDFTSAMQMVRQAEQRFMELPPLVRQTFKNNPAEMLEAIERAVATGEGRENLEKLGLLNAQETEQEKTAETPTEKTEKSEAEA